MRLPGECLAFLPKLVTDLTDLLDSSLKFIGKQYSADLILETAMMLVFGDFDCLQEVHMASKGRRSMLLKELESKGITFQSLLLDL